MFEKHDHRRRARWSRSFGLGPGGPGGPRGGMGGGFGFGGWDGRHGGPRGRGRRRNTRAAVLALLAERPMHGYEMISELEQRTGGVWRPSPGSIYPTLQMLEDEGLIVSEESGGRKRFTLTDTGRAEADDAGQPWGEFDEGQIAQSQRFREAAFGIMTALRQVGLTGTEEQRDQALEVLNETRRKLYAILAAQ